MKQRAELETKTKQQSQDQSDIYQYLRSKLKDNYVAIAELETKVRGGERAAAHTATSPSPPVSRPLRVQKTSPRALLCSACAFTH